MKFRSHLLILFLFLATSFQRSYGQSYGLGFYSHEVVQDQRTGLDLSPGQTLCFKKDFELSFDLTFLPKQVDYFGYILRLVTANNENIDLIYDQDKDPGKKNYFKIIVGDKFSKIAFDIPPEHLFNSWNNIKIRFDFGKKLLTLSSGKYHAQINVSLKQSDCFKVLFGANEYKEFKTTDIPPMKIRNIKISEQGRQKYYWSLDEDNGSVAKESRHGSHAAVIKPLWVKKMHYEWQLLKTVVATGPASVAFDAKNEVVTIVGVDSLKNYSVIENKLETIPFNNKINLMRGNNSIYNQDNHLLNIYTDQQAVSIFDAGTRNWSRNFALPTPITDYWQFNKFYDPADSSLYVVGGYGHFIFKNEIQRYHAPSGTWEKMKVTGDTFTPRYLAALGFDGTGAYIIGGFGSTTGEQMLNPRNLYDLLYFDVKKKTIRKIYELKIRGEDFVFANSMIINEKAKTFYALIFPKHKYKSSMQLIEGSLVKPEFKVKGSKVPYLFHDINSYADLYYCASTKRFIAVTAYRTENDQTTIKIYALNSPPLTVPVQTPVSGTGKFKYIFSGVILLILGIGIFRYLQFRRRKHDLLAPPELVPASPVTILTSGMPTATPSASAVKSSVFLFGDLQVFDSDGNEITKQFTPLIKELFLVILLYTIRWGRGISSDKLKELLWFDKSAESARNNRSVNIAKLKSILEKIQDCQISKETGYWRIKIDAAHTYVDYQEYINIVKDKNRLNKEKITALAEIIKRGSFLSAVNYEWMDTFKAEISNEIIDTYLHFAHAVNIAEDPELLIELANYIFYFDSINEEAMAIKCKALVYLGKHSLAKNTFENFCKEYKLLYGDDFEKSFNDILNTNNPDT